MLRCKVFTATMARERAALGDDFNEWHQRCGHPKLVDTQIRQSSDSNYHCLSIIVFYEVDTQ